ncbi:MAG: hypothetical protein JSS62_06710 [Verrucomicrobia bacterium]|nr:hypothetical protein [Verrucomicrobiota bacterium]MBS0646172.1 hypothetical protein [Verrucomicrobiota bacterium]
MINSIILGFCVMIGSLPMFEHLAHHSNSQCKEVLAEGSLEHFVIDFPEEEQDLWQLKVEKSKANGQYFAIWCKDNQQDIEERFVTVASPFLQEEPVDFGAVIEAFLAPVKSQPGVSWQIYEQNECDVLLGWKKEEEVCFARLVLTSSALHSLVYSYRGADAEQVDGQKWLFCLQNSFINHC